MSSGKDWSPLPWTVERTTRFLGRREIGVFSLRVYAVVVDGSEELTEPALAALEPVVAALGEEAFSSEFDYHNIGFLVCNVGRRGVNLLLYHFGTWVDMPEVFHIAWYKYAGEDALEFLDRSQPTGCYADAPVLVGELALWRDLARAQIQVEGDLDFERLYSVYLDAEPVAW